MRWSRLAVRCCSRCFLLSTVVAFGDDFCQKRVQGRNRDRNCSTALFFFLERRLFAMLINNLFLIKT